MTNYVQDHFAAHPDRLSPPQDAARRRVRDIGPGQRRALLHPRVDHHPDYIQVEVGSTKPVRALGKAEGWGRAAKGPIYVYGFVNVIKVNKYIASKGGVK